MNKKQSKTKLEVNKCSYQRPQNHKWIFQLFCFSEAKLQLFKN